MKYTRLLLFLILIGCSSSDDSNNDTITLSDENSILGFSLNIDNEIINGNINQENGLITFDLIGAELSSLVPIINYSEGATIFPSENTPRNFNQQLNYTITAENGDQKVYQIITENRPIGTESKILDFSVNINSDIITGVINETDKIIILNTLESNVNALTPSITISDYASISPSSGIVQDFESPVEYEVTAEDGSSSIYTVFINSPELVAVGPNFGGSGKFFAGAEFKIVGYYVNPSILGSELLLKNGDTEYVLNILDSESVIFNNKLYYMITAIIPENVESFDDYQLIYRNSGYSVLYEDYNIDVLSNGPNNLELNQAEYFINDIFILTGNNLVPGLVVPSNGNQFIIENSVNYDIQVNEEETELTWTLDYNQLFPSFFADPPQEKKIYTLGEGRRVGRYVTTIFN